MYLLCFKLIGDYIFRVVSRYSPAAQQRLLTILNFWITCLRFSL